MKEITHYDQLFKELDNSLKKSFNQFMAAENNDIKKQRKEFSEFGELEIDRILKNCELKRHQIDWKSLLYMRMIISMQMIEII